MLEPPDDLLSSPHQKTNQILLFFRSSQQKPQIPIIFSGRIIPKSYEHLILSVAFDNREDGSIPSGHS